MELSIVLLFISVTAVVNVASSSCYNQLGDPGNPSLSNVIHSYPVDTTYLNLEDPVTCTVGLVSNITFCYLVPSINTNGINIANYSIWKPDDGDNQTGTMYKLVEGTSGVISYDNVCPPNAYKTIRQWSNSSGNEAMSMICRTRCFENPIIVHSGYVLGLTLVTSDTDKRIFLANTSTDQTIGLCQSNSKLSSNGIPIAECNSTNKDWTLLLETTVYVTYCNPLTPPTNGTINTTHTVVSTVLMFDCNEYYKISSPLVLMCAGTQWNTLAGIQWDGVVPTCTYTNCTDYPYIPEHAVIVSGDSTGSSFIEGTIITIECESGYHFNRRTSSNYSYSCLEGSWNHANRHQFFLTCVENHCTLPDTIDNGFLQLSSESHTFPVNTTVQFGCHDGYVLSNPYPLLCLSNETWNASSPECIEVTATLTTTSTDAINATGTVNNDDVSTGLSTEYRFLIVAVIVGMFVILFGVVCALMVLVARRRGSRSPSKLLTADTSANGVQTKHASLTKQLLSDESLSTQAASEISPYSAINMPAFCVVSSENGGVAYFSKAPFTTNNYEYSSTLQRSGIPLSPMSVVPHPPSPLPSPRNTTGLTTPQYISPCFPPSIPGTGVPAQWNQLQELEESLKSEQSYWSPATAQEELYLQLNTIKVQLIPPEKIRVFEVLGSGEFATVNKGLLIVDNEEEQTVAIKTPKSNFINEEDKVHFLREAAIMGQFNHTNVLKLFGLVISDPNSASIVVEYMEKGDLLTYLQELMKKSNRDKLKYQLLNFSRQVCLGMAYLSGKGFIHRDLAARNIMVSKDETCKIADFGMSRDLEEEGYYLVHEGAVIPVKWTAPEAIQQRKYSTASDVWSFGCVLYEIWSLGCKPFKGASTVNAIKIVKTGQRLTPPPGCPREIYQIMIKTWHPVPKQRPTFNEIMLLLLKSDEDMLMVPDRDSASHPDARELGADLKAGVNMYTDLQRTYLVK